jgi:hypothetical protein
LANLKHYYIKENVALIFENFRYKYETMKDL